MNAPLHERLDKAAKAAKQLPWVREPLGGPNIYSEDRGQVITVKSPAIAIHPEHHKWDETREFLLAAQPANVAKLCEQVRAMKEALRQSCDAIERATQPERVWNAWTPALVEALKSSQDALASLEDES